MKIVRSICRKIAIFFVNKLLCGTNPLFFELKRKLLISIGFIIGEGTKIVAPIECNAKLTIGRNCWIGKNFIVNGNGEIDIGNNCDIAPEVTLFSGGHEIGTHIRRAGKGEAYKICIKNGVWVGGRVIIMNNVTISSGSVIAAAACVVNDVGEDELVGGVPARVIRSLNNDL